MLTTVASFTEPWEAHLFRGRLEAEGLLALVAHDHHMGVDWPWAMALGGVKVQVPGADLQAAREIEDRCRRGDYADDLAALLDVPNVVLCQNCGSARFQTRRSIPYFVGVILSYWMMGVIFPVRNAPRRCLDCGTAWQEPE